MRPPPSKAIFAYRKRKIGERASEGDRGGESQEDEEGTGAGAEIEAEGRRGCYVEIVLTSSRLTSVGERTPGEASHTGGSSICGKLKQKRVVVIDAINNDNFRYLVDSCHRPASMMPIQCVSPWYHPPWLLTFSVSHKNFLSNSLPCLSCPLSTFTDFSETQFQNMSNVKTEAINMLSLWKLRDSILTLCW